MNKHVQQIRVSYEETDKMGVVYHANYLRWFDQGRTEYLRALGVSNKDLEDEGVLIPVLESHCNHHVAAQYDELVTIVTKISNLKRFKISFEYEVFRSKDNELLATGKTVHGFVNDDFNPVYLKKFKPEFWKLISVNFDN